VDVLYHESTFTEDELIKATETLHSTAIQAASIAKMARVDRLFLGHFSARYKDLAPLLSEARMVFENSYLALEGEQIVVEDR
jgi:ribonuclease Z